MECDVMGLTVLSCICTWVGWVLCSCLRIIIEEAEEVSTSIYGTPMSIQEQQDYMWNKASVSVFDLEALEKKALERGEEIPWANDKYDHIMPPNIPASGSSRDLTGGF